MKLSKNWKRIIAGFMAFTMVFLSGGVHVVPVIAAETVDKISDSVIQQEEENEVTKPITGYYDIGHVAARFEEETVSGELVYNQATVIPESYSSVEKGYVTSIKNQYPWGTCWAFAACAAMESYALSHGLVESAEDVDFSEYALAYLTFKDDMYSDKTGDYTVTTDLLDVGFNAGGNDEIAFKTLSKWAGIYNEGTDTYYADSEEYADYGEKDSEELPAYQTENATCDFVLTGQYYINIQDTEQIKAAIMENGAVTANYYSDDAYVADNKHTYNYNYEKSSTNHAIAIVGWDDSLDKNLFTITDTNNETHTPEQNGAWLVKNSWGTYYGKEGYIWISYEDMGLLTSDAVVYEIAPKEMFDNIYQHDGSTVYYAGVPSTKFASIYTVDGTLPQKIQAVSFAVLGVTNRSYQVDIYKNENGAILESGALVASTTGKTTFEGYYTALFDTPVTINPNESYSVVITFDETAYMLLGYNGFPLGAGGVSTTVATSKEGECYAYYEGAFTSLHDESVPYRNLCIKMYTTDVVENETPQITDVVLDSKNQAIISWQTVADAVGYKLWIGETSHDEDPTIISVMNDEENIYDSYAVEVALGSNYYYKVCAIYGEEGNYTYSPYSVIYFYEAEIPAVELEVALEGNIANLSWNGISFVDGYQIFRSQDNGEYQLLKEILSTEENAYVDENLKYGSTYQYYVVSYIVSQPETEEIRTLSHISNTPIINIAVPAVSNFMVNDYFYQRMTFTWTGMQGIVNGYELNIYATDENGNVTSNVPIKTIDIAGGAVSRYVYDTSSYSPGTFLMVGIRAYINGEDGTKVKSKEVYTGLCTVMDEPIEVGVEWYVKNQSGKDYIAFLINNPTLDSVFLCYYSDVNNIRPDTTYPINLENGKAEVLFDPQYIPFAQKGYLYFTDGYCMAAFQDDPITIGGAYVEPELEVVEDVVLSTAGQSTQLTAVITNALDNFDYRYQWYVAEEATGAGVAIEGANEAAYEVTVGSFERKYYYCTVTAEYSEIYTINTVNESGEHTCIVGELFGSNVTVGTIADQTYTGKAIIPELIIKDGDTVLVEGTDYTVNYTDNINAGTATGTITFLNNYINQGTAKVYFRILPKDVEELTFSSVANETYCGSEIKPKITVNDGETVLKENVDYTITYHNNLNAGFATIVLKFKGNYTGEKRIHFTILQKSADKVSIISNGNRVYSGQALEPDLLLKDGDITLVKDKDYIFTCSNNINAGTAKVIIRFVGNYTGIRNTEFTIDPKPAELLTIESIPDHEYYGVGIIPEIVVKDGEVQLKKGDYSVACTDNIERGTAKVTLTFAGNYSGTLTTSFQIVEKSADNLVYEPIKDQTYSGELLKPEIVVKNGDILLVKGTDYDVVYTNNMNVGAANAVLAFKGNYKGTKTLEFNIVPKSGAVCTVDEISDYTYTGEAIAPVIQVKDGTITLVKDVDYTVEYSNNVNAGEATVTVVFQGNYTGSISTTFEILPVEVTDAVISAIDDQKYAGKELIPEFTITSEMLGYTFVKDTDFTVNGTNNVYVGEATLVVTFTGNYSGTVETSFDIVARTTENVVISAIPDQRYTGLAIKPELEIKDGNIVLVKDQDYTVKYQDNVEEGTAKVIVRFKGNFTGEPMTTTFTIYDPIPTAITSEKVTISETSGYMSKISVGTTVSTLLSYLNEKEYVSIFDKKGNNLLGEHVVGTGMTAGIVDDDTVVKRYIIVVTGDTNGDGKINITDMIAVKACTLKRSDLTGAYEKAGDVNGDGKINITDFIKVKATTLKKDTIIGVSVY